MADETSENDTFVSVDMFAPTQTSIGEPSQDPDLHSVANDSVSLSEYIGEADEDLLTDDLLDHAHNPNSSAQYSHPMRVNTNRHDSAFMWTLTNEPSTDQPSPEAFRQTDSFDQGAGPADDTLSLGDDGDVCASFDTATFSGTHELQSNVQTEESSMVPESPQHAPSPSHYLSSELTPDPRRRISSTEPSSDIICSSERPPLPPTMSPNSHVDQIASNQDQLNKPDQSSYSQEGNVQNDQEVANEPEYIMENRLQVYDPQFNEASHGFSASVIDNPFFEPDNISDFPRELVVISKIGPVDANDQVAFRDLVTSIEDPKCRLVKRLVETIVFQRHQLDHVKDSEVNLAGTMLDSELRRYSDVAHERSFAIDGLIEEVDSQRNSISYLEQENEKLKEKLQEAENKVKQVEDYYSNFVDDFDLSGNVATALENVNDGMDQFRRESIEQTQKSATEVEDYASRLLKMENIVAGSRERMKKLEAENNELRFNICGDAKDSGNLSDDNEQSPIKPSIRLSLGRAIEDKTTELNCTIDEQHIEIDNLRLLLTKSEDEQKKVQEAFLSLNVELEEARAKSRTLQRQRDAAETKCRELSTNAASEKKNYIKLSNEMSKNIVQVIGELDRREAEMRHLRSELEDRESAFRSLQCTNQDIEDQLQAFTEAALDRSRSRNNTSEGSGAQPLIDTFIKSLQNELSKAQALLQERAQEMERAKKLVHEQDESIISLQKECSRLQAAAAIRRRSGSVGSPNASSTNSADEDRFLRRLSEKLGCKSSNNRELIEQLAKRLEALMVDHAEFQEANEKLRQELAERERGLHNLRSEMQAEISALKAEATHQENLKSRAQEDLKNAEDRLLHVLNEGDLSRRDSFGDITISSVGTRAWMIGDEEGGSRRASMISSLAGDDTIRWNDPIIDAAVQSVSALIGTKDSLAARNRELREKLQGLINALAANDHDGSARAAIIQSKELQDELTGVVGLQQDIIDRLAQAHPTSMQPIQADDTLPFIRSTTSEGNENISIQVSPDTMGSGRLPLGEATRFLNEQLASTRSLYSEKLRANVELCGVVEELQEELQQYKSAHHDIGTALGQLQETHDNFLARLSEMTGAEKSVVAIEDFIRASLHDMMALQSDYNRKEYEERISARRICGLIAQKRVLMHIISMYQCKYRLNILATPPVLRQNVKRRLRVRLFAVVAVSKLLRLRFVATESVVEHNLPEAVDISQVTTGDLDLTEASLALTALPRVEKALAEKDEEIARLESTIESLNRSAAVLKENAGSISEMPRTSYMYNEDVLTRKNDLSRRLRKLIREKEDLEQRISQEKQSRLIAEAKVVKYVEKVAAYKKRLGVLSSRAESKENTYKAAIRYLKNKADKAVQNDFNLDDENIAPWDISQGEMEQGGASAREPNAATRAMLQDRLDRAEAELAEQEAGSEAYDDLKGYSQGLRRAIQRLQKPLTYSHRPQSQLEGGS